MNWDPTKNNNTAFLNRTHWSIPLRYVPHNPIFHEEFRFDVRHPGVLPTRPVEFISRTATIGGGGEHRDRPGHLLTGEGGRRHSGRVIGEEEEKNTAKVKALNVARLGQLWLVHTPGTHYHYTAEFWKNNKLAWQSAAFIRSAIKMVCNI